MPEIDSIIKHVEMEQNGPIYEKRIKNLKNIGFETNIIEEGIQKVCSVIERGVRSFVIYGEPQSGKTEVMIALTCKLIDLGFRTIFIVVNDNTELEKQNFYRFQSANELNPAPLRDFQLIDLEKSQLKQDKVRVIFCRKNSKNLQKLIENCRYMKKRVVIDDEADFASVDTNINKIGDEATAINRNLSKLGELDKDGFYIGVTATPGRLDLNNTFSNNAKEWIYLASHKFYYGRSFFFPIDSETKKTINYNLLLLPDEGDNPVYLRKSILRYLIRSSLLNLISKSDLVCYSMLIHTAGKINDHLEDKKIVDKTIELLTEYKTLGKKLLSELIDEAKKIVEDENLRREVVSFILQNIGKNQVVIINSKNDRDNVDRACNPAILFTFAIGGNIVSRGLTFKNLLTFFFSRSVKGKLQQNTYIQRARMFGNRPYAEHFELTIPKSLFEKWADAFQDHELSIRLGMSGNLAHIERITNRVADNAAIDKANITVIRGEREVGEIFDLNSDIETILFDQTLSAYEMIEKLIELEYIDNSHFPSEILSYIAETSKDTKKDTCLVLKHPRNQLLPRIQEIEEYKDGDSKLISRARGGIIQALINKRDMYKNKIHYILPIKNKNNQIRFIYRQNLGQKILQNMRSK